MITFKPVVYAHQKRKDGTYNIKIRITYKGVHRHLATNLYCSPSDLTKGLKLKNNTIIAKSNKICDTMRECCGSLNFFQLEQMKVDDIVSFIKKEQSKASFSLDFFSFANEWLLVKTPSTRLSYLTALRSFERYLGRAVDINELSKQLVTQYYNAMKEEASVGTAKSYIFRLKTIYNAAKAKYNDDDTGVFLIPRNAFDISTPERVIHEGQRNLGVEVIQKMIDTKAEGDNKLLLSLFLLSFCTMGANLADIFEAATPRTGVWVYNRKKTRARRADKAEMRVKITPQAQRYIDILQANGRMIGKITNKWKLSNTIMTKARYTFSSWAEGQGIEPFTMYAARHSWASIARKAGVDKATIDECLAHIGDYRMADIYAERDWERINEANAKVLSLFSWD